jgi:hypothetical protein
MTANECPSGKIAYQSPGEAQTAAKAIARRTTGRRGLRHYRCTDCPGWHLTLNRPVERRNR